MAGLLARIDLVRYPGLRSISVRAVRVVLVIVSRRG